MRGMVAPPDQPNSPPRPGHAVTSGDRSMRSRSGAPSRGDDDEQTRRVVADNSASARRLRVPPHMRSSAVPGHDLVPEGVLASPGHTATAPKADVPTVWARFKQRFIALTVLTGSATLVNAAEQIMRWSSWELAVVAPVLAMGIASTATSSIRRTLLVAVVVAGLAGVGLLVHSLTTTPRTIQRAKPPPSHAKPSVVKRTVSGLPIRAFIPDGSDLWALRGAAIIQRIDIASLSPVGPAHRFGSHIDHATVCGGHLLITYDGDKLAELSDSGRRPSVRVVTYGHPVPDRSGTGMMVCAGRSLLVALPLEARILRLSLPRLKLLGQIARAAERITGLTYSDGVIYVEDASQTAVITVRDDIPFRWKMTAPGPAAILPMQVGGALVAHGGSSCLGRVDEEHRQEIGLPWSGQHPIRLLATSRAGGIALDTGGRLYRFNSSTGALVARPVRVADAEYATTLTVTPSGETILGIASAGRLIRIARAAWKPIQRATEPAPGCLLPVE
jgi:hypothetical protein